jgi:hypothetical protein
LSGHDHTFGPTRERRLVLEDGSVFPGRGFGSASIPLLTGIQPAQRFVEAIDRKGLADLQVKSWMEYRNGAAR